MADETRSTTTLAEQLAILLEKADTIIGQLEEIAELLRARGVEE